MIRTLPVFKLFFQYKYTTVFDVGIFRRKIFPNKTKTGLNAKNVCVGVENKYMCTIFYAQSGVH